MERRCSVIKTKVFLCFKNDKIKEKNLNYYVKSIARKIFEIKFVFYFKNVTFFSR